MLLNNELIWPISIFFVLSNCLKSCECFTNDDYSKRNHIPQSKNPTHYSSNYRPSIYAKLASNTHFFKAASQFRSVISLDTSTFMRHVIKLPRNFSIVAEFTITNQDNRCPYCYVFHGEYQKLADSYKEMHQNELYFVSLNFKFSEDIFKMFNILTVPHYVVFSNKGKTKDHRSFKQVFAAHAEALAKNLRHITGIHVNIKSRSAWNLKIIAITFILFCFIMLQCKKVRIALTYRYFWATLTVGFILLFSSGTMVNYMQSRPFSGRSMALSLENYIDRNGQYIVESLIITTSYMASTILIVLLHYSSQLKCWTPVLKYGLEVILGALLLVNISFLVKIFRFKYQHFPFKLLFD